MDHINNGPYQSIKEDPTTNVKTKTFKLLKVMKDNEFIDCKLYYYLIPATRLSPTQVRSSCISYCFISWLPVVQPYKYIADIFTTYIKDQNNNARNSATFSNYIWNVPIEDEKIMTSFDVTFLYKNIPIIDSLNITKDYVNNDDQFTRKTVITQDKFLDLTNVVLTTTWYT